MKLIFETVSSNPADVVFWSGAGVSCDRPSSLPLGEKLTRNVVEAFCLPNTWEDMKFLLEKSEIADSLGNYKTIPRLEAVLGNIVSVLGYNALDRIANFNPSPNFLHYFFAQHIMSFGKHVTLNLDIGIENAITNICREFDYSILLPHEMPSNRLRHIKPPWILHLHGKYGESPSTLGLTMENVSKGITDKVHEVVVNALSNAKTIIFAGYSGSDVFDVNPFFESLVGRYDFSEKNVVWIDHTKIYRGYVSYLQLENKSPILNALSKCNANCRVWIGPTVTFFKEIQKYWGFQSKRLRYVHSRQGCGIDKNTPGWQRHLVTGKVFVSMGLGSKALEALNSHPCFISQYAEYCYNQHDLTEISPANKILYLYNEAYREIGLYKKASSITDQFILNTDSDIMLIYERRASDAWLSGSLLYSRRIFLKALHYGETRLGRSNIFDSLYLETLRAYMQLCRDFQHIPVIGLHMMSHFLVYPATLLANSEKLLNILSQDPYNRSHIARLFLWEKGALTKARHKLPSYLVDEPIISSAFGETDNILGTINTRRSKIHLQLSQEKSVDRQSLIKVLNLSLMINDNPGSIKACLMLLADLWQHTQWSFIRKFSEVIRFIKKLFRWDKARA